MAWPKIFHFSYFRQFLTQFFYSFYFLKHFFHICIHDFLLALILYPFSSNSYRFNLYLLQLLPNLYYLVYFLSLSLSNMFKKRLKKNTPYLSPKPFCRLFASLLSKFKPPPLVLNLLQNFFGFLESISSIMFWHPLFLENNVNLNMLIWQDNEKVAVYKMIACHH